MSKSKLIINAAKQGEWKWKVDKHFTASLVSESGTILEAVYSDNHEETADIGIYARSHDMDFITTFNPEHVALMEAVIEAVAIGDNYPDWAEHPLDISIRTLEAYRKERGLL